MQSILSNWQRFKGWQVLELFLEKPDTKIHLKELARKLEISSFSAMNYLKLYHLNGVLKKEIIANSTFFELQDNFLSRELKKAFTLMRLTDLKMVDLIAKEIDCVSLSLYGSYSLGSNDSKSDLDLLAITSNKAIPKCLASLESKLAIEINYTALTSIEWRKMLKQENAFCKSVIRNHVLLLGSELIE